MAKRLFSALILFFLFPGLFQSGNAQSRTRQKRVKSDTTSKTIQNDFSSSVPGEAVVQIHRDFAEIPITLSPRGVLIVDYPRDDRVYILHTSKKFLLIDTESRLEHDPIVVRTGDELPSNEKGDPGSAVLTVQMDSGLFVTFLVTFTKSPKLSTHRVVLAYAPREIAEARAKLGLYSGYQKMADGSRTQTQAVTTQNSPVATQPPVSNSVPASLPSKVEPSPGNQTDPALEGPPSPPEKSPSEPKPIPPTPLPPGPPPSPTIDNGAESIPVATTLETSDLQESEGIGPKKGFKKILAVWGSSPSSKIGKDQIQSELQKKYDEYAQQKMIQFGQSQSGLSSAILSRGRLDPGTAYVVIAIRNVSPTPLFLLSDQPVISLVTKSLRKNLIDSRVVTKFSTIGVQYPFELKPGEHVVWAVAYPSQILGDNQTLQVLVYQDRAANRPIVSPIQ